MSDDYLTSYKDGIFLVPKKQEAPTMVYCRGKSMTVTSRDAGFDTTKTTLVDADQLTGRFQPNK